ncbi:MAG TPA: alternative ribosome rescue aminoacyl-tRNA hydrolase ArfB [Cyclobacteriaceae bacterium]|nr:alternative ribosome rescue aminoacyl-tRNA hydrolase ArfB [Cyclobacteriaceae bacterium]
MNRRRVNSGLVGPELVFSTSRSSGPGGQNVNKVNTKVTLKFDVAHSEILSDEEKEIILKKLESKITTEGILVLSSQDKRSQLQNKEAVVLKLEKLLQRAFEKKKVRKATKPSKSSVQQRITKKKQHAEKKKWRQKPF